MSKLDHVNSIGTAIKLEHVSKLFSSTTALNKVNASFEIGCIHGLLGRNGAGKTTR